MQKIALITGITGQDGSYLAEFLLEKGYEVHGLIRRHSIANTGRIDHLIASDYHKVKFFLHYADTTDSSNLMRLVAEIRPTEVYNLAAQSHVGVSFEVPEYTAEATGVSTLKLLEAIRVNGGTCRYYHIGAFRRHPGDGTAEREDAFLSEEPLRRGEALFLLDHGKLQRVLQYVCLQRHSFQPRITQARREFCDEKDHAGNREYHCGQTGEAFSRQYEREERLGVCGRLYRGHVADAAAGQA